MTFSPGANKSTTLPKLENDALESEMVLAPTVIADSARAGEVSLASTLSFPAATYDMALRLNLKSHRI